VKSFYALLFVAFLTPRSGGAQAPAQPTTPPPGQEQAEPTEATPPPPEAPSEQEATTGVRAFVQVQGSSTSLGAVLSLDADLGYDLTPHLGADAGAPVYLVRNPFSLVTTHDWRKVTLWGSPYVDVRYTTTRSGFRITSVLTGTIPASGERRIFTTGRFGGDWFNHIELDSKRFTPFLNAGAANGTVDRYILPRPYSMDRPYQTLGFIADFEGGASYEFRHGYRIGASAYALQPAGPQKVFSRLVAPDSPIVGDLSHNRYFYNAFETKGTSKIARDNGFSGWVELVRRPFVTLQLGYTRSIHYRYDSATVMLNINATSLFRGPSQ
jgi:hypothetical protein